MQEDSVQVRQRKVWRTNTVILACILVLTGAQFVWRDAASAGLERAGAAVGTILRHEAMAYDAVRTEAGRLLAVLARNVKIAPSRTGCIQTGCPAHHADGKPTNEG